MSRREKTSIGLNPLMAIAVLLAVALAVSFPFALVHTMPKQLSPLEQAKASIEQVSPAFDGETIDLNSLRVLTADPNGTVFLAGYTDGGSMVGIIYYEGSLIMGTVSLKDGDDVEFAGGGTNDTGYLYVQEAPRNKLGFHYCAQSQVGPKSTEALMKKLALACGATLD